MDEAAIRKKVCDEIEVGLTALLEKLANVLPNQPAALLGVSLGMMKVIGDARARKGGE